MDIEQLATSKVVELISRTKHLTTYINAIDKNPIWDGLVHIYDKPADRHKKQDYRTSIPVQVKATMQDLIRDACGIHYVMETDDLNAYLTNRPTVFFVVTMNEKGEHLTVYYRVFKREDTADILRSLKAGQKRKRLIFSPLPTEPEELEALFLALADGRPDVTAVMFDPYLYNAGTVAFRGRDEELKALDAFLGAPERFRWWGVAAAGGAGKTRLAHEWRKQVEARGWVVLWAKSDDYDDLKRWSDPAERLLLIADYAWQHVEALGKWMDALCQKEPFQKVRVLLLERDAGEEGGEYPWEKQLYQAGNEAHLRRARHDKMLRLAALDDGALQGLMWDFAASLQAREPELSALPAGEEKRLLARLEQIDELRRPLFAMLLTDSALRGAGVPDSREALLERIVERERAQHLKRIPTLSPTPAQKRALERLSTELRLLATALGADGDISAERLAELLPEDWKQLTDCAEQLGLSSPEELLLDLGLLRVSDGALRVPALRPDLLGEYALLRALRDCGATQIKRRDALYAAALGERGLLRQFVPRLLNDYSALLNSKLELWEKLFPPLPELEISRAAAYSHLLYDAFYRCTNREQRLALLANIEQCTADIQEETDDAGTVYNNLGLLYHNLGAYSKALQYYNKSRNIMETVHGTQHPETAASYNNLGTVYRDIGDLHKALEYCKKALTIRENVLGTENPDTAQSYNNLGTMYRDMGDLHKALIYCKKALEIDVNTFGAEHLITAQICQAISVICAEINHLSEAHQYAERALNIREKILGIEHPDTADSYRNIGMLYYSAGDLPKALEYYKKALIIRERVFGTEHPSAAQSYNNLGALYYAMGDLPKALEYQEKALAISEKVLGSKHPSTAQSYNNLGALYRAMGDYPHALAFLEKALAIREKALGTKHPSIAESYRDLGAMYRDMGDLPKALEAHKRALAIREKILGLEHPDTVDSYNNLGVLYRETGDLSKALQYKQKALVIREKVLGAEHPDTAQSYYDISFDYMELNDLNDARYYAERALEIWQKVLGAEHPHTKLAREWVSVLNPPTS